MFEIKNKNRRPNTSEEVLTPVPEHFAGPVFPYRGQETHGVDPTPSPHYVDETADNELENQADYEDQSPVAIPVPVVVVNEHGRELKLFRTGQTIVPVATVAGGNSPAVQILGDNRSRNSLRITNHGATEVYVGNGPSVDQTTGYQLPSNASLDLLAESSVWVCQTSITAIKVSWLAVFVVDE